MSQNLRIVLLDDNADDRLLAIRELRHGISNLQVHEVADAQGFEQVLATSYFDLAITDYQLCWSNGLEILRAVKSRYPECPVIMFTNTGSEEVAVEGMKAGLDDYVIKSPKSYRRLVPAVRSALERVEAQQRATRAELRFRELLNRLNVGVFRLTLNGRLLEGNAAFLRLLGWSTLSEAQSDDLSQLYLPLPEDRPNSLKQEREVQLRRADGSEIWVAVNELLSTSDGETIIDGLMEDITQRKQAEAERDRLLTREQAARSEAEEANRLKDEFLATVSHELRTPLNALLGWSNLLRAGNIDRTTAARAFDAIERNTKSLAQLVEDLLDVSRIITGKFHLKFYPVALVPAVIEPALENLRLAAAAKGIQFDFVYGSEDYVVAGDRDRLQQVVWNLLSNAVKFTPQGGKIEVRLECVNSTVEIQVSDTGQGISSEFLPYVFDRFRQADSSTTRMQGGLGLGLSIVRYLVELHGGTVRAESLGENRGATFTISLPIAKSAETEVPSGAQKSTLSDRNATLGILSGLRILVVDDAPDMRDLFATVLECYGAMVETVGSADEAINSLERNRLDVLVSDIGMPGEDGYALMRRVRALSPKSGGQIPALALTAYARAEDRMRALAAGYQMHVAKPVAPAELAVAVASLAGRSSNAEE